MQEDPVYDFPDPQPVQERRICPQRASLKSISVLDRLLLTHPVWLQLSVNSATALHILQREPPGTFLVRKSNTSHKKVLCVRLADDSMPSFVRQFAIREQDSSFSLESSAISFPDLCRLVAFYCVSRDVLPFTLKLPEAIAKALSHKQLESISHMGVEFWGSQLNFRGPRSIPPPVNESTAPQSLTPVDSATPHENPTLFQEFCPIRTRSPLELDCGWGQGALCFVNPLFLQEQPGRGGGALHKRHQFKRSLKVRVSTETSSPLSPPAEPPPPPPLFAKGRRKAPKGGVVDVQGQEKVKLREEDSNYLQPCFTFQKRGSTTGIAPALSPTAEEDYQMPKVLLKEESGVGENSGSQVELVLEHGRAPSLSDLGSSSSLSSLEEGEENPERPPLVRGISTPLASSPPCLPASAALRKMSAAFMSFFTPERRVSRLVEDLSRDRRSAFGALVQDFLQQQRETLKVGDHSSALDLLRGLRLFLSQAKDFLLDCRELEPPIEILVPENEKDLALEKAMFRCVLKPLKGQVDAALRSLHAQDGSLQLLAESLHHAQEGTEERLGIRAGVLEDGGVEKVRRKLLLMQRAYSPVDKVVLLLQVCKSIYKAMKSDSGQAFGADEFLPALTYVIMKCNLPELLLEVEYMMELLESSWLTGEGGYYLTSVYASLCLIQSQPETMPPNGLTSEAREVLREWTRRRSKEAQSQKDNRKHQGFVRVLLQDGECSYMKTLQWEPGNSAEVLAQLCAAKFGVVQPECYALYNRGGLERLPPQVLIQDLGLHPGGAPSLIYRRRDLDDGKMRTLVRGGTENQMDS